MFGCVHSEKTFPLFNRWATPAGSAMHQDYQCGLGRSKIHYKCKTVREVRCGSRWSSGSYWHRRRHESRVSFKFETVFTIHHSVFYPVVYFLVDIMVFLVCWRHESRFIFCSVDRNKYQIHIPLPPKIDPTVTMMQVLSSGYYRCMFIYTPFRLQLRTRMHSSRIRTARLLTVSRSARGDCPTPPIPEGRHLWMQTPTRCRTPWSCDLWCMLGRHPPTREQNDRLV